MNTLKDDNGAPLDVLIYSKSPLKRFSESAFRAKRDGLDPTNTWPEDETEPGAHLVLAVFGYLIYNPLGTISNVYSPHGDFFNSNTKKRKVAF